MALKQVIKIEVQARTLDLVLVGDKSEAGVPLVMDPLAVATGLATDEMHNSSVTILDSNMRVEGIDFLLKLFGFAGLEDG